MVIDTKVVSNWAKIHLSIVVPVAVGLLSWFAAQRWQAAITQSAGALEIFYFFVCAVSGILAAVLTVRHLIKLGFFD